jgi:head-tail adaptor
MKTVSFNFSVSVDDFINMCDTAGYVIGYWADSAEISKDCYVIHEQEGETYRVTPEDVETAMAYIVQGKGDISNSIRRSVQSAIAEDDLSDLDGCEIDVIIQVACFKEIVYG